MSTLKDPRAPRIIFLSAVRVSYELGHPVGFPVLIYNSNLLVNKTALARNLVIRYKERERQTGASSEPSLFKEGEGQMFHLKRWMEKSGKRLLDYLISED